VRTIGSYWQLPERLYDEPDEVTAWARAAHAAAGRAALAKRSKVKRVVKKKVAKNRNSPVVPGKRAKRTPTRDP
jgi:DNA transformation protein